MIFNLYFLIGTIKINRYWMRLIWDSCSISELQIFIYDDSYYLGLCAAASCRAPVAMHGWGYPIHI